MSLNSLFCEKETLYHYLHGKPNNALKLHLENCVQVTDA